MDFRERLKRAAQRGNSSRAQRELDRAAEALSEEELRRRHSSLRLMLTEHIEERLTELADSLPGFHVEPVLDDRGWGSAAKRDDLRLSGGRRENLFSRLQVVVSPFNAFHVLDVTAKGTIHNKETFSRGHHEPLASVDEDRFRELVELWVLDYAEAYAAG